MSAAFAVLYALIYVIFVDGIVWLLTDIPALKLALTDYYVWIYLMPLACFLSFLYDGIFVGLGWDKAMRNSMAIAAAIFFLFIGLYDTLGVSLVEGNHVLWFAFISFMLTRGVAQVFILKRNI